jgi:hypothetical protein
MLERNIKIKTAPEQWHAEAKQHFNIVITFEERVFDAVFEGKLVACTGVAALLPWLPHRAYVMMTVSTRTFTRTHRYAEPRGSKWAAIVPRQRAHQG